MKVKLTCNWCDDNSLVERFKRVYVSKYNLGEVEFTSGNDFEYLLIINHPQTNKYNDTPVEKTIGFMGEPSWSIAFFPYLKQKCKHIFYHNQLNDSQIIYYPGLLPTHFDLDGNDDGCNLDYYIDNNFAKQKKCSLIVSYRSSLPNAKAIYDKRVNFAKMILQTNMDIDIYGNGWEASGIVDSRIKGRLKNKKHGLLDYEFSIALENCVEEDYFTEKLTDCILTDTTPIYYGCPNISRFFNNVYQLSNIDNLNDIQNILNKCNLNQDANKKLMATKYNLYYAINKYIRLEN